MSSIVKRLQEILIHMNGNMQLWHKLSSASYTQAIKCFPAYLYSLPHCFKHIDSMVILVIQIERNCAMEINLYLERQPDPTFFNHLI